MSSILYVVAGTEFDKNTYIATTKIYGVYADRHQAECLKENLDLTIGVEHEVKIIETTINAECDIEISNIYY